MELSFLETPIGERCSTLLRPVWGARAVQASQVDSALPGAGAAIVREGLGVEPCLTGPWLLPWESGGGSILHLPPKAAWLVSNGPGAGSMD